MLMILLSTQSLTRHVIYGNNWKWHLNMNLIYETLWTGAGSWFLISFIAQKTQLFCMLLIHSMNFLSPEVALHLFKSII